MMTDDRFERNRRFFGAEGQVRLLATRVSVVGACGLGGHVIQQLAFLGVRSVAVIDSEYLDLTNRNRLISSESTDPIPGTLKVALAKRLVRRIDPDIGVIEIPRSLRTREAYQAVIASDFVFGCVDSDDIRLVLAQLCSAYEKPFIDASSDIESSGAFRFGGRVCFSANRNGCLLCLGQIDAAEAGLELHSVAARIARERIYGIDKKALEEKGPSVVSINGVVASLAVTEFMAAVTGIRPPLRLIEYRGDLGKVFVSTDAPAENCFVCSLWGKGAAANLDQFLDGEEDPPVH